MRPAFADWRLTAPAARRLYFTLRPLYSRWEKSEGPPLPVEAKPLFRPDVLRPHLGAFALPDRVDRLRPKLGQWADLLASRRADALKEQGLLPDFITDFCTGCSVTSVRPGGERYTISRERHVVALMWATAPARMPITSKRNPSTYLPDKDRI